MLSIELMNEWCEALQIVGKKHTENLKEFRKRILIALKVTERYCIRESYHKRSLTTGERWYTSHEWSFYYSDGFTETVTLREYT